MLFIIATSFFLINASAKDNLCYQTRDGIYSLYQWTRALSESNDLQCTQLKVGESRTLNSESLNPTLIHQKYRILRRSDKEYIVTINPFFKSKNEGMRNQMQKCLKIINPYLLGPNEEKLTIELASIDDKETPQHQIEIQANPFGREHSEGYTDFIGCRTMAHEILHILGLIDEYKEPENRFKCRAIGPQDSVMHNQHKAVEKTEDYENLEGEVHLVKACVCKNYKCSKNIKMNWPCPEGFAEDMRKMPAYLSDKAILFKMGKPPGINALGPKPAAIIERTPVSWGKSLLYPAHFRAIIQPGCYTINSKYYRCAQKAYLQSCPEKEDVESCLPDFVL